MVDADFAGASHCLLGSVRETAFSLGFNPLT
jgi:hypothetical protein